MSSEKLKEYSIPATACEAAMQRNRVDTVVTVPDWVQLALHSRLDQGVPGIRVIACANENQTLTVGAGLVLGGRRPLVIMQNQGLYNCINTLRALCLDARIPLVLMVGQFGREYSNLGQPSTASRRTMVRIMEPMLDAMKIPYFCLDNQADLGRMDEAYVVSERERQAVVMLVSAPMAWS